ncbi:MAG: electron transfer flavoprotein subunit alpha/FixB family protein [Sandaracinaceae bacterium]|nr:electron transfer flavoprotein subunit alpha/FixB family protein [Sandaracinaceae bacterium]
MVQVLVVAELLDRALRKTTLSAITFARQLNESKGGVFDVLVIGEGAEAVAHLATRYGARKVFWAEIPGGYVAERYAPTVAQLVQSQGHNVVVATASTYGKDLLPRVAARFGAGVASDIAGFSVESDGSIVYRRPMYAGNIYGYCTIDTPIHVVSVRQTEFEAAAEVGSESPIEAVEVIQDEVARRVEYVSLEAQKRERPELAEAEIVVSGGRALKSAENFKRLLEPLADVLGAAIGASRAACDAGYAPNDLQVGQTGKVVAPKLYIAIGISGAIQHLAGMKGSKVIVAINTNKDAPIAAVADYFLVADLFKAVPELTEELKRLKSAQA